MRDGVARSSQASEVAYERLRVAILDGSYPPGARLAEKELSDSLHLSRTPIRDALRRLSYEGLVDLAANRGARVARTTVEDLKAVYDLREMLEVYAARRAATRIAQEDLDVMERLGALMEAGEPSDPSAYADLVRMNDEFHSVVHRAAGSRRLLDVAALAASVPVSLRVFRTFRPEDRSQTMRHHPELVAALAAKDPEWAAAVASAHVRASRHAAILALLRAEGGP